MKMFVWRCDVMGVCGVRWCMMMCDDVCVRGEDGE